MWSRKGSSDDKAPGLRSKAVPTAAGDQKFLPRPNWVAPAEPWTISMADRRTLRAAAVFAKAGVMASSHGNATVTPSPRRTVRRDMCFFVIIIAPAPLSAIGSQLSATGYRLSGAVV